MQAGGMSCLTEEICLIVGVSFVSARSADNASGAVYIYFRVQTDVKMHFVIYHGYFPISVPTDFADNRRSYSPEAL